MTRKTMGIKAPGASAIAGLVVPEFMLGLLIAWVYAAVRPRLGAGAGTAVAPGRPTCG